MILRAKTKNLFSGKELTAKQNENSKKNIEELESGKTVLTSYPRRLVFELTNACNLNCIMCTLEAILGSIGANSCTIISHTAGSFRCSTSSITDSNSLSCVILITSVASTGAIPPV